MVRKTFLKVEHEQRRDAQSRWSGNWLQNIYTTIWGAAPPVVWADVILNVGQKWGAQPIDCERMP